MIPTGSEHSDGFSAQARIQSLRERLSALGRPDVRIIGVSKTHGPDRIVELYRAGLVDFGENRQNEARDKFPLVARALSDRPQSATPPVYHHIGPLQSGSARQIPGLFHYVHGVSSIGPGSALEALSKAAERKLAGSSACVNYLIQVALTGEAGKVGGMPPDQIRNLDALPRTESLRFCGFMTMGPENQEPALTRETFHRLRELRDEILPEGELSMGMSGDWELAVAEGATMIRVGTALFGPRGPGPWRPTEPSGDGG